MGKTAVLRAAKFHAERARLKHLINEVCFGATGEEVRAPKKESWWGWPGYPSSRSRTDPSSREGAKFAVGVCKRDNLRVVGEAQDCEPPGHSVR